MNVLLLDNNDSFTYNIVDLFRQFEYVNLIVKNSIDKLCLDDFDRFVISPGPSLPKDFPQVFELIKYSQVNSKPLLGVCLGFEAIAEYFNAKLFRQEKVVHGQSKIIKIDNTSLLYKNLDSNIKVGLYHSWAVSKINFPDSIKITALSEDDIIMSLEHKKLPIYGIQYHLESFLTKHGKTILSNFLEIK